MDEQQQAEIVDHEFVGRRLRDHPEHHGISDGNGSFRVLVGAFMESRPGAHISVDRFWAGTPSAKNRATHIHAVAEICTNEQWGGMKGWACATAKLYGRVPGIQSVVATPRGSQNPRHADLVKEDFLLVAEGDTSRVKKQKALMLAQQLADNFNSYLEKQQAEVIPWPAVAPRTAPTGSA